MINFILVALTVVNGSSFGTELGRYHTYEECQADVVAITEEVAAKHSFLAVCVPYRVPAT